jgi:hypothetical protein
VSSRRRNPGVLELAAVTSFVEDHPITTLVMLGAVVWWVRRPKQAQQLAGQFGVGTLPNPPTWASNLFGGVAARPPQPVVPGR